MLCWTEHEKKFYNLGAGSTLLLLIQQLLMHRKEAKWTCSTFKIYMVRRWGVQIIRMNRVLVPVVSFQVSRRVWQWYCSKEHSGKKKRYIIASRTFLQTGQCEDARYLMSRNKVLTTLHVRLANTDQPVHLRILVSLRYPPKDALVFHRVLRSITNRRLYNFDPLNPHLYMVKLEFTGVYIIFISAQKCRLSVLARTASTRPWLSTESPVKHHENMPIWFWPHQQTPLLYGKTGVYRGIHYFSYFCSKYRLWVLVRTVSPRRF